MDAVKLRLIEFLDYINLDKSVFERRCGFGNGFVDKTNSRMKRSSQDAISRNFPELNMEWLMTGNGEMIIQKDEHTEADIVKSLLERIDRLIDIHERDSRNMERLLTLLLERSVNRDDTKAT